jgi:hypothetical protein
MDSQATMPRGALALGPAWRFAWRALIQHFGLFAASLLMFLGAWAALEVIVIAGQRLGFGLWLAVHIAFLIVFGGLSAGFTRICLELCDGGVPGFSALFAHLLLGPKFVAGQLIYLLLVAAGLALLVVPGLYLAGRFAWFGFRLMDGETALLASFGQSAALSRGASAPLAGLAALLLVFNVVGACLLGIGLVATVPVSVFMLSAIYRQLLPAGTGQTPASHP